jgi:tRNA nucleotidyltransferase (CCA-adding enzyme)
VVLPNGLKLDVATARLEYYEYPAALPTVELSSIKLDLYRRDFTINAMAIQLNRDQFGKLIDFFNSQNDLKQHAIKVLHNLSFVDDPTRIFRAIRFEQRMDFIIVKHTQRLINNAVKMNLFGKSDDPRFFSELKILLNEEQGVSAILRLEELGLFTYLWPDLKPHLAIDQRLDNSLKQAQQAISWFKLLYLEDTFEPWIVYLLTIMGRSPITVLINFCNRFQLTPKMKIFLINEKNLADKTASFLSRRKHLKNSEIFTALRDLNIEGLLYLIALARKNEVKQAVSSYVTALRLQQPLLNGDDLKDMGYQPGPLFKTLLETLLLARLDETVSTRQEEIELLKHHHPLPAEP